MRAARIFAPILIVLGIAALGYLGLRDTLGPPVTAPKTNAALLAAGAIALAGGIVCLVFSIKMQRAARRIDHGCRSDYGPLELRIQTTGSSSGFMVYVEDPRAEHRIVYEQAVQSTLESAKEYAALRANEYLSSYAEAARYKVDWGCS